MSTVEAVGNARSETAPAVNSLGRTGVARSIIYNWASLIIGAVVAIILTPMMIRGLGQYYYGLWVLGMSITDQYGLLDLGMTAALSRFAGYFRGSSDRSGLDEIFSLAFALTLLMSALICALSAAGGGLLSAFFQISGPNRATFVHLVLLLGLTTAVAFPERMLAAYLRGIQRFDLFNLAATGATVTRAVLFVGALRLQSGVATIALITLGMQILSFGVHYGMVRSADPGLRISFTNVRRNRLREMFGFSLYAFIASVGTRFITRLDSIVIGRILTVALIAPFNVASRLTDYFVGVFSGVYGPVLSAMSELDGASKREELRTLFIRSSRYTFLLSFFIGSLLIVDGRTLLRLWLASSGLDLDLTYKVLVILTLCYATNQAQLPSWSVINARARHQLLAGLILCEGIVNLGLSIYWGRRYGLVGIALGTTVPSVIHYLLITPYYALRVIEMPVRMYIAGLLRPLAACALFACLCRIDLVPPGSILALALLIACQTLIFGSIAYFIALHGDEKRILWMRCREVALGN